MLKITICILICFSLIGCASSVSIETKEKLRSGEKIAIALIMNDHDITYAELAYKVITNAYTEDKVSYEGVWNPAIEFNKGAVSALRELGYDAISDMSFISDDILERRRERFLEQYHADKRVYNYNINATEGPEFWESVSKWRDGTLPVSFSSQDDYLRELKNNNVRYLIEFFSLGPQVSRIIGMERFYMNAFVSIQDINSGDVIFKTKYVGQCAYKSHIENIEKLRDVEKNDLKILKENFERSAIHYISDSDCLDLDEL